MKRAIFPGTFDPFTIGHFSVVKRALTFMDEIIIGIGINDNKRLGFQRRNVLNDKKLYADEPRIQVEAYDNLTVDFAQKRGAKFIIRGIRTVHDLNTRRPLPISTGNLPALKQFCFLPSRN